MTDESRDVDATDAAADDTDAAQLENENERDGTDDETATPTRSTATDELWEEVGIAPVKIALPRELVGYTLRAYRPADELTPTETVAVEDEDDPFAARERARAAEEADRAAAERELLAEAEAAAEEELDAEAAKADVGTDKRGKGKAKRDADAEASADEAEEPAPEDFLDEPEEADEAADEVSEDVPVFLSHRGKLLLFPTPEDLLAFITSGAPNDLAQLESWPTLVKRVRVEDLAPTEDDTYELDLVVENLRGGHSAWDLPLLISAGEIARDIGYALRLEPVLTALSPGSPLDDLDDAVRSAASGGLSRIFARRRLRRIGAQQASLGWRTIIGKITAAVDWRD